MSPRPEHEELARQFEQMGIDVDSALPAWTGLRPFFGGYSNVNLLVTQWRVLVVRGGRAQLWTRWNGLPSKCLLEVDVNDLSLLRSGRRYDRIAVGQRRVWIPSEYRSQVTALTS